MIQETIKDLIYFFIIFINALFGFALLNYELALMRGAQGDELL